MKNTGVVGKRKIFILCFMVFLALFAVSAWGAQLIGRPRPPQHTDTNDPKGKVALPGTQTNLQVPNVVGLQYPEAAKRLEATGFKYHFSTVGPVAKRNGVVVSIVKRQNPAGGATVPNGTRVQLFFK